MKGPVRILVADSNRLVRFGLGTVLGMQPEFEVLEATTAAEALTLCRRQRPQVLLADLALPDLGGQDLIRRSLRESPSLRVIAMCGYGERDQLFPLLQAGARGCLLKDRLEKELLPAVEAVLEGELYVSRDLVGQAGLPSEVRRD